MRDKRSKYRFYLGWLWNFCGRCWHCGGKESERCYVHLKEFNGAIAGDVCKGCGYFKYPHK